MGIQFEIILFLLLVIVLGAFGFWGYHKYAVTKISEAEATAQKYQDAYTNISGEYQKLVEQVQSNQKQVDDLKNQNDDLTQKLKKELALLNSKNLNQKAIADAAATEIEVNQISNDIMAQLRVVTDPNWTHSNDQNSKNTQSAINSIFSKLHNTTSTH